MSNKKTTLSTYLKRAKSPSGQLLIRAMNMLKVIPSQHTKRLISDIEEFTGVKYLKSINPDNTEQDENSN